MSGILFQTEWNFHVSVSHFCHFQATESNKLEGLPPSNFGDKTALPNSGVRSIYFRIIIAAYLNIL